MLLKIYKRLKLELTVRKHIANFVLTFGIAIGSNSNRDGWPNNFGIEVHFLIWTFEMELSW